MRRTLGTSASFWGPGSITPVPFISTPLTQRVFKGRSGAAVDTPNHRGTPVLQRSSNPNPTNGTPASCGPQPHHRTPTSFVGPQPHQRSPNPLRNSNLTTVTLTSRDPTSPRTPPPPRDPNPPRDPTPTKGPPPPPNSTKGPQPHRGSQPHDRTPTPRVPNPIIGPQPTTTSQTPTPS
nr:proline-rich receptor-like protein kinase PERK9 [Penaeus vannamei]